MSSRFEPSDPVPPTGNPDPIPADERASDDWWTRPIPPLIEQGNNAFRRDLPELMQKHKGQWVAYHGEQRLGLARTQTALYQECFRRGLKDDEFVVRLIEPGALEDDFDDFPGEEDEFPWEEEKQTEWTIQIPPLIEQGNRAFRRDLPELMKTYKGRWVAYHGDERIGFARTQLALYQECFRRGLKQGEFVVRSIEPELPDEINDEVL